MSPSSSSRPAASRRAWTWSSSARRAAITRVRCSLAELRIHMTCSSWRSRLASLWLRSWEKQPRQPRSRWRVMTSRRRAALCRITSEGSSMASPTLKRSFLRSSSGESTYRGELTKSWSEPSKPYLLMNASQSSTKGRGRSEALPATLSAIRATSAPSLSSYSDHSSAGSFRARLYMAMLISISSSPTKPPHKASASLLSCSVLPSIRVFCSDLKIPRTVIIPAISNSRDGQIAWSSSR
mmetsp:Transcript_97280/g.302941  ORF Transcript_97280/g.302941 Transcript_97280/m.302941 type:complete len:239 (+) Transcript_97280:516-1232(+)